MFLKAITRPIVNNLTKVPARNTSAVVGVSSTKVPLGERIVLGSIMVGSWLIIPAWVLLHLREYKAPKE